MSSATDTVFNRIDYWRLSPTSFIETALHDPETGRPFMLLKAERDFLQHAFKTGADGRLRYPELIFGAPKKSGKTGFAALHMLTMSCCSAASSPKAMRWRMTSTRHRAASSRPSPASSRPVPMLRGEAKITADKITFPAFHNATISAIAIDYAGAAGANPTISCFDELWAYISERGRRLWDEMVPPPTRKIACRLTVTYAGFEGESDAARRAVQARSRAAAGRDRPLCRRRHAHVLDHEPIAPWQTPQWLDEMRRVSCGPSNICA